VKLIQLGDHWINPEKIISIAPFGGSNEMNEFYVHVDMRGWTASYAFVTTTDFNPAVVADMVNGAVSI
jgi:hypothetical protein